MRHIAHLAAATALFALAACGTAAHDAAVPAAAEPELCDGSVAGHRYTAWADRFCFDEDCQPVGAGNAEHWRYAANGDPLLAWHVHYDGTLLQFEVTDYDLNVHMEATERCGAQPFVPDPNAVGVAGGG